MALILLAYRTASPPNLNPADMVAKVAAVPLFEGELDMLGYEVAADLTLLVGTDVVRQVYLQTTEQSDTRFPTPQAQKFSTANLYTMALASKTPARFNADPPVII